MKNSLQAYSAKVLKNREKENLSIITSYSIISKELEKQIKNKVCITRLKLKSQR